MRIEDIIEGYVGLFQATRYNIALTIKPNRPNTKKSDAAIKRLFDSIYRGICRKMGGTNYDQRPDRFPRAIMVIEGDRNNRHLHCSFRIEGKEIMKFCKIFANKNMRTHIIKKHDKSASWKVEFINNAGWMRYCTKEWDTIQKTNRIFFYGPSK